MYYTTSGKRTKHQLDFITLKIYAANDTFKKVERQQKHSKIVTFAQFYEYTQKLNSIL